MIRESMFIFFFFTNAFPIVFSANNLPTEKKDSSYNSNTVKKKIPNHSNVGKQKNIICTTCGYLFLCQSKLQRHQTVHTGEKKYKCVDCSQLFSQKSSVKTHRKNSCPSLKKHLCKLALRDNKRAIEDSSIDGEHSPIDGKKTSSSLGYFDSTDPFKVPNNPITDRAIGGTLENHQEDVECVLPCVESEKQGSLELLIKSMGPVLLGVNSLTTSELECTSELGYELFNKYFPRG